MLVLPRHYIVKIGQQCCIKGERSEIAQMPLPPGWKVWENAPLLPGGGGGERWALLELTDA